MALLKAPKARKVAYESSTTEYLRSSCAHMSVYGVHVRACAARAFAALLLLSPFRLFYPNLWASASRCDIRSPTNAKVTRGLIIVASFHVVMIALTSSGRKKDRRGLDFVNRREDLEYGPPVIFFPL